MNVGRFHSDSKSGTLHLHMDCCRVDLDGNTNDVHDIHKRAMMAAEIINMRHGWKQPQEIRDMQKEEIKDFCEYTLRNMQEFDIDFYFKMLRMKGYEVTPRYDKSKKLVGYTIGKNASVFKASEIGRRFMASQLEATWIPPLSRMLPTPPCFSLLATSMQQHPCPNLAEVAAVPPLNLVGARRMTKMNVCLLADASRWLTSCASQSQLNVVIIVKSIPYVKYQKK